MCIEYEEVKIKSLVDLIKFPTLSCKKIYKVESKQPNRSQPKVIS